MVENQYSINNTLSFGAKSVHPKILEKLLIGREKTVSYLNDTIKSIVTNHDNHFVLIIGQRGMGKTHLIRVLYHRIQDYIKKDRIVVAYFSEEEYGVANYFDFLQRVINSLMKWHENDKEFFQNRINDLIETPINNREYFAEKIIEEYLDKRPLLILAENFADILEAIKPKEQAKLRAWLYRTNYISIIATSQAISKDFEREDRPFYGTFTTYYLKKLSYEDTVAFLTALAEMDESEAVLEFIKTTGKGQIKALHSLVKGNHRLLVTFYQFLKTNTLTSLSENFIKTINDLKPYYETYIRNLPPQQQKVLRYIALNRKPLQGKEISRNCFIDQKSLAKQLSELTRKNLVEAIPNPNDKRNKLYDIDEPLLRISIEVGEHKEGITAIFIDFLAIYYNEKELISKKENFENLLGNCNSTHEKTGINYEIQALEKAINLKKTDYAHLESNKDIQEAIKSYLANNSDKNLFRFLKDENLLTTKDTYYFHYAKYFHFKNDYENAIKHYKNATELNPKYVFAFNNWGAAISELAKLKSDEKLFIESIEKYKKATELNPKYAFAFYNWGNAISELAKLKSDEKLFKESFAKYKKATELNPENTNAFYNWGIAISDLAKLKSNEKLFKESFAKYKKATELNPKYANAFNNWGNAISNLAKLKSDEKLFTESFAKYKKATELNPKHDKAFNNWGIAISDLARLKSDEKLFTESFAKYKKATELYPNDADAFNNWGSTISDLAKLKSDEKLFKESFAKYKKARELNPNDADAFYNWGIAIYDFAKLTNDEKLNNEFVEKTVKAITLNQKNKRTYQLLLYGIENLPKNENISIQKALEIINKISENNLVSILNQWLLFSLKEYKTLSLPSLQTLQKIAKKHKKEVKELQITEKYIEIYQRYVLENDKKAIYDLPKEQRLFFEEHILGE